jgi:alpha-glucosidase
MVSLVSIMALFVLCTQTLASSPTLLLDSPDSRNRITIGIENDGRPFYEVSRDGQALIERSYLGLMLDNDLDLSSGFSEQGAVLQEVREEWQQPWGEVKKVHDHCSRGEVELLQRNTKIKLILHARAYNDGVAFHYELPEQKGLKGEIRIMDEITEFNFAEDLESWWTPAYWWNRYEYLTQHTPLSESGPAHTPMTFQSGLGNCLALHEAALTDYASMALVHTGGRRLKADLVPWSDGVKVRGILPIISPWRVLITADQPAQMLESTILLNLNEASKISDTSWIKPAKYTGIWWEMHLGTASWGSGERHGATTTRTKNVIDFAAKYELDGVLVEGWNTGWDGNWIANGEIFNFTQTHPEFDMEVVQKYAAKQGVELIGHHETGAAVISYERQLEEALDYYKNHDVCYIKTGYVGHGQNIKRIDENGDTQLEWHHGQYMVRHYRKVTEEAARRKIMLCVHEPIHDSGIRRTWPNLLSREGARGQEFNAWGPNGGNPVDHTVLLAYTRMLSGPMDYTPGIFDLLYEKEKPDNRVSSTLAHQLALYVVLYSPVQMLPDLPKNYEARPDAFQFLLDVPVDWNSTKGLAGEIGEYIVIARQDRNSTDWYLGAITNGEECALDIPLDFLGGGNWQAELYHDGEDAHWETNPYSFIRKTKIVNADSSLPIWLAAGGGAAIRFVAQ